jgi:hypothetical protein
MRAVMRDLPVRRAAAATMWLLSRGGPVNGVGALKSPLQGEPEAPDLYPEIAGWNPGC